MSSDIPPIYTSIIPLNEEYFLALHEQKAMLMLGKKPLPISYIQSRKTTFDGAPGMKLRGAAPWEEYLQKTIETLHYTYDSSIPEHSGFSLQKQAERDRQRKIHAVFIDLLELELKIDNKPPYKIGFRLKTIPKESETGREVKRLIELYRKPPDLLYSNPAHRAQKLYQRIFACPSCLELNYIVSTSKITKDRNETIEFLAGMSERALKFQYEFERQTGGFVLNAYKRYDIRARGYILDGLVRKAALQEVTA
jgi:hypothetical protein